MANEKEDLALLQQQLRHNERVWSGFQGIAIDAIAADSLQELGERVVRGIERTFDNIDCACIACVNLDFEIERLLSAEPTRRDSRHSVVTLPMELLEDLFSGSRQPRLERCDERIQALLFPGFKRRLGSVALSPLIAADRLIGCLAQGSVDPRHFSPSAGTELLTHLSAILALCIQNLVNRARLERDGLTDPLTNVGNRRFLERRLGEELARCHRHQHDLACLMVDIDHFKQVNDAHGHGVGDLVLREVAQVLKKGLRSSDLIARYGGEEFVILLPECNRDQGCRLAERQRMTIASRHFEAQTGHGLRVTVSIGVASHATVRDQQDRTTPELLIAAADRALYEAKHSGRNRVATGAVAESRA